MQLKSSSWVPSRWLKFVTVSATLVAICVPFESVSAQDRSLAQVQALGLQKNAAAVDFYHSAGASGRAAKIASLVAEAREFFKQRLGLDASVTLAVLNESDWRKINPQGPYGIPYLSGSPHVVFMPATDDNVITASVQAQEKSAPAALLNALRQGGQSYADWSRTSVELIALHELGHAYVDRSRVNPGNKWFNEFLASYYAYSFLAARHPALAQVWRTSTSSQAAGTAPKHTSINDFERLYDGVGPENYGWYQALFIHKAAEVHDRHALRFIELVHWSFPKLRAEGDWLEAFLRAQESIDNTTGRLQAIDANLASWATAAKGP